MFACASLRSCFVAMSLPLGVGVAACSPLLPPPASPSVAALTAIAPPPAVATSEPSPSDAELARANLLYPYNLPQYDEFAAEIAADSRPGPGLPAANILRVGKP